MRGLRLEDYEFDVELGRRFEAEIERASEVLREFLGTIKVEVLLERMWREIMFSIRRVVEPTDDPWRARFTVLYPDFVYDNVARKVCRVSIERVLPVLVRYGDVGVLEYPGLGSSVLIRKERVIDDLKDRFIELLKMVVDGRVEL